MIRPKWLKIGYNNTTLCYAMLYYAMLCYTMLCYTILCYAMLYYAIKTVCFLVVFNRRLGTSLCLSGEGCNGCRSVLSVFSYLTLVL